MELEKEGEHDASLTKLTELMEEDTPYVPAFFMAGQQLARLDRLDDAKSVLRNGIDQAQQSGDSHAAAEMSEFLQNL